MPMQCCSEGELRAFVDREMPRARYEQVSRHLAACQACQRRLDELRRAAAISEEALAGLDAGHVPALGAARVREMAISAPSGLGPSGLGRRGHDGFLSEWRDMMSNRKRVWRSLAVGLAVLMLVIGVFSFPTTRALARQLLSIFRVQGFSVVQVDPDEARLEEAAQLLENQFFAEEPELVLDGPVAMVGSVEEARVSAGFQVLGPTYLPGGGEIRIEVKGGTEFTWTVDREALALLLQMAGMDPSLIPADLEGEVRAAVSSAVNIGNDVFDVIQVWGSSVEYPDGLDPQVIAQAALQILGMSPQDVLPIVQNLDWSTTLLLPVPVDLLRVQETQVAGVPAFLLVPNNSGGSQDPAVLMWVKDDVVCAVVGQGSSNTLLEIAESMYQ